MALLKTFADQAVIAIENVRLFKELGGRNARLRGSSGTSDGDARDVPGISSSPTDVQPVLDAIVESGYRSVRACGIDVLVRRRQLLRGEQIDFASGRSNASARPRSPRTQPSFTVEYP